MTAIPRIKTSDVSRWTDATYFQRGQSYYSRGAIYEQRRQGMGIKSKCSGSQAPFYRQEVLFNSKGIESAECSCPVEGGGQCKHTVALLLTWIHHPESFQEVESLDASLDKRSKPELIALIKQMLEQEPDLETLLELPIVGAEGKPINIKAIHQQAQRAFQGIDFEWGYAEEIKRNLNPLLKLAAGYLSAGDVGNAALVYMTLIEAILDNADAALGDEEGSLLGVVYDCAEALGECLGKITQGNMRIDLLQSIFNAYIWDTLSAGGVGAADCVPGILTSKTIPGERAEIAKWTRAILPKGDSWSDNYHRQVLGNLLLALEADILDDEAYLKICRETGRLKDLIERLIKLNRIPEAADAARSAEDYALLLALDIFVRGNHAGLAEKLVSERIHTAPDNRLLQWLSTRLKERGDLAGSLKLEEGMFWKYPSLEGYETLAKLAIPLERWADLRKTIIADLQGKKQFDLLIRFYLSDNEVGNALEALTQWQPRWGGESLRIEVAEAAKKQYPYEAIRLFTQEAERNIDLRNRQSYSQAAAYLREVRDVQHELGEVHAWNDLIAELRARYKKLPALQDELNQLKL